MRKFLSAGCAFCACFFILPSSLEADTFKWVDDKGVVHYSDQSLNGKDADWVDDAPEIYFSYKSSNELTRAKARVLPSRKVLSKTGQQKKIAPKGYGQTIIGGGASAPRTSARKTSTFRQNSVQRSSAGKSSIGKTSTFRQNSVKRSSAGQGSTTRQNSVKRSSAGQGSIGKTSTARKSGGRTSRGRY
ncbi:hypothetical protein MNBD_NITROSPINAE05-111 [hydrothermal vent metagenome]|uniref:DUF4124 domain-containing protein n=1 Tax=hydrothermal vent metagenome TaxID=652676 RepID=A0A3B1CVZ1_9ZZZZ